MDNNQFAKAVKQKYPQYASIPNDQLTQAVMKKYPQYQSIVQSPSPMAQPQPQSQSQQPQQPQNGADNAKLLSMYAKAFPQSAPQIIGSMIQQKTGMSFLNPLQQAQADYLKARAQNLIGPGGNTQYATPDQALQYLKDTPEHRTFIDSFGGRVPWTAVRGEKSSESQEKALADRSTWVTEWKQRNRQNKISMIYNQLNQLSASSGNVLGQAAQIQFRAQRGIDLLNSPEIKGDARTWALVQADLASIAQGGSPTISAQAEASMPTLRQNAARLMQILKATPDAVNQPAIKEQLNSIFRVMQRASSSVIDQNTDAVKALWKSDPEATQMINDAVKSLGSGVKPIDPRQLQPLPAMPGVPTNPQDANPVDLSDMTDAELLRAANQ